MKNVKYKGDIRRTVDIALGAPTVTGNSKITAEQSTLNFIATACYFAAERMRELDSAVLADNYKCLANALYNALDQNGYFD